MKNVTISMDEKLAQKVRVEAAKAGKSMSRYIATLIEASLRQSGSLADADNPQLKAISSVLAGPQWSVLENGQMPTADERNSRD